MIIAIDVETRGLDATKYLTGCIAFQHKKPEIYRNKKDLWKRILQLKEKEKKRGHTLTIYSHNASYDFYSYADLEDKHLAFYSEKPFIVVYKEKDYNKKGELIDKETIQFLDTMSIYRMSLKKAGQLIGLTKGETPNILKTGRKPSEKQLQKIEEYMHKDTEICLKLIEKIKQKMKEDGVTTKKIITINQLGISYFLNKLKKLPPKYYETYFEDTKRNIAHQTLRTTEIHQAYRGGRVEAFKTGTFQNCQYIDCNSLYPYSATQIEIPDLRTERKIHEPLQAGYTETELLNKIGLSKCLIYNPNDEIGLLPLRTPKFAYTLKKGQYGLGTWTHIELKKAIELGYQIKAIEWSIIYKKAPNYYKKIIPETYKKRKQSKTDFDNYYYKAMMNTGFGKLGQTRNNQIIKIDTIEKSLDYLEQGYEVIKAIDYNYIYRKKIIEGTKKYYAPILPTLINAYARIYMYDYYKEIGIKNLIYTDTDSIVHTGKKLIKNINEEMGQFKIEDQNVEVVCKGKKSILIGEEVKVSGFHKYDIDKQSFKKGHIKSTKMQTIKTAKKIKHAGKFSEIKRNLNEQEKEHNKIQQDLREQKLIIDDKVEDITYFIDKIPI